MRFWVTTTLLITALILATLGAYLWYSYQSRQAQITEEAASAPAVTYRDSFKAGVHTISGTVVLRNRCERLEASAVADTEVDPPVVRVDLFIPEDTGICLELPTERAFSVSVEASDAAMVQVFVNGIPASGEAL